jgi:cystathionine gamma-synthase
MSESSTPKDRPHGLATDLLHADDGLHGPEVSPSISVTTSSSFSSYLNMSGHHTSHTPDFRHTESPKFTAQDYLEHTELARSSNVHVYSRVSQSVSTRVEHVLSKINVSAYALLDKHPVSLQGR